MLRALRSNDLFVEITWDGPDQTERGATTQYEVGYVRTATDCMRFARVEPSPQADCSETVSDLKVLINSVFVRWSQVVPSSLKTFHLYN